MLTDQDLAFSAADTACVCIKFGVSLNADETHVLRTATKGWVAATILAAARLARSRDPRVEVARIAAQPDAFRPLVENVLSSVDREVRAAAIQFAHLPFRSGTGGRGR